MKIWTAVKKAWPTGASFWPAFRLTAGTLAGLIALAEIATVLYAMPDGRFPAKMIAVMRDRALLKVGGLKGYYQGLNGDKNDRIGDVQPGSDHPGRRLWSDVVLNFDHSFRMFRFKPNLVFEHAGMTTNSLGMVGPERSLQKPPHTRRVALLGSSMTSGHMVVRANENFGALLEARLNSVRPNGERFEVLNFACIAYSLPQIVDVAVEDAPRFDPDVYLLALDALAVSAEWDGHLVRITHLGIDPKYDFLRTILNQAGVSRKDDTETLYDKLARYRMPALRAMLEELKSNAARHHATFIVLLMPTVEVADLNRRRMEPVRNMLASLHVPIIDAMDSFDAYLYPTNGAFPGDPHPNARGHAMIFGNLYKKLRAQPDAWAALAGIGPETAALP
jgi:hypothetical protein